MWNDAMSSTIISPPRDATGQPLPVEALADDECATERLRAKNGYPGRVRTRQIHPVAERMSTLAERH
jgi:hypothetical protein